MREGKERKPKFVLLHWRIVRCVTKDWIKYLDTKGLLWHLGQFQLLFLRIGRYWRIVSRFVTWKDIHWKAHSHSVWICRSLWFGGNINIYKKFQDIHILFEARSRISAQQVWENPGNTTWETADQLGDFVALLRKMTNDNVSLMGIKKSWQNQNVLQRIHQNSMKKD